VCIMAYTQKEWGRQTFEFKDWLHLHD
jgi:hypothetical protein